MKIHRTPGLLSSYWFLNHNFWDRVDDWVMRRTFRAIRPQCRMPLMRQLRYPNYADQSTMQDAHWQSKDGRQKRDDSK